MLRQGYCVKLLLRVAGDSVDQNFAHVRGFTAFGGQVCQGP